MPTEGHPSSVSGTVRKPFAEQVAFFRLKLRRLIPTARWDDLWQSEHDSAFMVAGAIKADLLTDLVAAVDRTIAEGKSLEAFRKDFRAIVERHGWHGWTGEDSAGGRAWRTRTIYRTNAATSYAAGRFAQLSAGNFAFWVYLHGGSQEPRLQHLGWNGLFLPPGHGFWIVCYPPSGWGCSCYVVGARSERGAIRLGGDPNRKLADGWDAIDPKTGAPAGIGKGWGYAPGATVAPTVQAMAEKVRQWDHRIAKAFMEDVPAAQRDALARSYRSLPSVADDLRRYAQAVLEDREVARPSWTLGLLTGDQADAIGKLTNRDVSLFDFSIAPQDVKHIRNHHGDDVAERRRGQRAIVASDYSRLGPIVNDPDSIEQAGTTATGEPLVRFVKVIGGERHTAIFAVLKNRRAMALKTFFVGVGDAPPR